MNFSNKKFNIIVCFTIALICLAVVFSSVEFDAVANGSNSPSDSIVGDGALAEPENPSEKPDGSENNSQENEENMPSLGVTITNGWTVFNYAMELLEKYDHRIEYRQTIKAETLGITAVQKINKNIYNVDGKAYVKVFNDGSGVPMNMGVTYNEYLVVNGDSVALRREGQNLNNYTMEEYLKKFGVKINQIPYDINQNSAKLSMRIVRPSFGASYYELTFTLNSLAWKGYTKNLEANGGPGSNPKVNSITATLKINLKYGYIMSLSAQENYTISSSGFVADTNTTTILNFTYSSNYITEIDEIKSKI